jgi:predicted metal-dependent peptidase
MGSGPQYFTGDYTQQHLDREMDKTKSEVFIGKNAAFLGPLMCSMNHYWDESVPTACTDGASTWWNPRFFLFLKPKARKTLVFHELWHPARLHFERMGSRDPLDWNIATDHRINNDIRALGDEFSFEGLEWCCMDPKYANWAEEDIYDDIHNKGLKPPPNYIPDLRPGDKNTRVQAVNNVVRAIHAAKAAGGAGAIPGDLEEMVNVFLTPVVQWDKILNRFMSDLQDFEFSWRRPNRRYSSIYMPSQVETEGGLANLRYYEDASGSITLEDGIRFNSEVKYVKEVFQPKKLTVVQFDTQITQTIEFAQHDPFNQIRFVGRGGTNLACVREDIIKHRPTAAIIFSDLECAPMEKLPFEIPVIWIAIRNREVVVPFGTLVHIH